MHARLLALKRWHKALGAAVPGLVSLSVYLLTLAPGLTWAYDSADGGELATCAYTLGIAHPPGYPTYALLAHLVTRLPFGEVATRTNLFSALCAAGTVAVLAWMLARMVGGWAVGAGTALLLAFSPLLWSQAIVTEVHALNAFFSVLLLSSAASTWPGRDRARHSAFSAAAVGVAWGLSLGNHVTALFCAPLVFLALYRLRQWWLGVSGIVVGLSVYLYLPLRAAADPPISWGDPRTLARVWWVVSGKLYQPFVFSLAREHLGARLLAWSGLLSRQYLGVGLLLAGVGAAALVSIDRPLLVTSSSTVVLGSLYAVGYDTADSYLYLIPTLVCLGLWLGVGIHRMLTVLAVRRPWLARVGSAAVLVVPLLAAAVRLPAIDLSKDRAAYAFAVHSLDLSPPHAVLLSEQDAHTFSLWYFRYALGWRPDVVVVDLDLLKYDWYTDQLSWHLDREQVAALATTADGSQLAREIGRPVCKAGVPDMDWTCWH